MIFSDFIAPFTADFLKNGIPHILPKISYCIESVWLALEVLSVLAIWLVVKWRPSYKFDRRSAYELISYGKQVVGANILVFLITVIDITFIGRILGADDLGYYSIALGIAGLLTTQVAVLMRSVMFPVYSRIQDRKDILKKAYLGTIRYVSLISIPASLGIFMIAPDFVKVVYGAKWRPPPPPSGCCASTASSGRSLAPPRTCTSPQESPRSGRNLTFCSLS